MNPPAVLLLPPAEGVRFDGTPLALPAGLACAATLVVVTFRDDAAPLSGQWARLGERLAAVHAGLGVLELTVLPPRLRLLGDLPILTAKTRAAAAGVAARTAVVYAKRKPFRRALAIDGDDSATALLVAPDGAVSWRGDGAIDLYDVEALEPAVRALLERDGPAGAD